MYEQFVIKTAQDLIYVEDFPRTMIKICFQLLNDDGGVLSTLLNAMNLALIDCGVPMKSTTSAVCCMISNDGLFLLDPTNLELKNAVSVHFFAFDAKGLLSSAYSTGIYTQQQVHMVLI